MPRVLGLATPKTTPDLDRDPGEGPDRDLVWVWGACASLDPPGVWGTMRLWSDFRQIGLGASVATSPISEDDRRGSAQQIGRESGPPNRSNIRVHEVIVAETS